MFEMVKNEIILFILVILTVTFTSCSRDVNSSELSHLDGLYKGDLSWAKDVATTNEKHGVDPNAGFTIIALNDKKIKVNVQGSQPVTGILNFELMLDKKEEISGVTYYDFVPTTESGYYPTTPSSHTEVQGIIEVVPNSPISGYFWVHINQNSSAGSWSEYSIDGVKQ